MAESELEKAFLTLAGALSLTETEIHEEITLIEQQIEQLKERILKLSSQQQTLARDRESISDMFSRYMSNEGSAPAG